MNGTTIPTGRDNTYSSDKVNRSYSTPRTPLVVHLDPATGMLDKTWRQINDAFPNVYLEVVPPTGGASLKSSIVEVSAASMYSVVAVVSGFKLLISRTPDGYPVDDSAITDDGGTDGGNPGDAPTK